MKALKWLIIIVVGGFVALIALGIAIDASKTPEERAADDARRAAEKQKREAERSAREREEAQANLLQEQQDSKALPQDPPPASQEVPTDETEEKRDAGKLVDRIKALATPREWEYAREESPFDGEIHTAARSFKSDTYDAEIALLLKCVTNKREFSLTFISRAFDANGNLSYASTFDNTTDMDGDPVAVNGRLKWSGHQPKSFAALLFTHNNMFTFSNSDIQEAANLGDASTSAALRSLLPAHFELANGAGTFQLSIPSGDSDIEKVLSACES